MTTWDDADGDCIFLFEDMFFVFKQDGKRNKQWIDTSRIKKNEDTMLIGLIHSKCTGTGWFPLYDYARPGSASLLMFFLWKSLYVTCVIPCYNSG